MLCRVTDLGKQPDDSKRFGLEKRSMEQQMIAPKAFSFLSWSHRENDQNIQRIQPA